MGLESNIITRDPEMEQLLKVAISIFGYVPS